MGTDGLSENSEFPVMYGNRVEEINEGGGKDLSHVLIGDGLIIAAQIIVALQMVIEEKFVNGKNIHPLRAVGWEGFFGACILSVLLVPFYYIILPENFCGAAYDPSIAPRCRLEDAIDGLYQENFIENHISL